MREIKFRAWDKERKAFCSSPRMAEYQVNINGVLTAKNFRPMYQKGEQQLELSQYTGLKIKNQEVYESDIVKARKDFVYKVVFENGSFVLYHLNRFADKENVRWGLLSRLFDSDMQDILKECEVIGNIYEHSYLLDNN